MDYPLPPLIHGDVENLLRRPEDLYQLLDLFGSPLNVILPHIMLANIRGFRQALDEGAKHGGRIYFAAKANKAEAFLAASAVAKAGADVSSVYELRAALGNGIRGDEISVSGPTKTPELLALACVHNARIGIDEPSEIDSLVQMVQALALPRPVPVFLRMASASGTSRFGMDSATVTAVLHRFKNLAPSIQLSGFSFHVPGYESRDRIEMLRAACDTLLEAAGLGLSPSRIDIGGGFKTAYTRPGSWSEKHVLDRDFMGNVRPQKTYPYGAGVSGPAQLREILHGAQDALNDAAARLKQPVAIDIEPGRSVLEQAGISVFRVRAVRLAGGRQVVVVDGNSRDLADSFGNEFMVDPVLVSKRKMPKQPFAAAIASDTCKEDDYLARRFVPLSFKPAPGDLLVYVNTAGYEMDSKESSFHRLPLPTKVVAVPEAGGWRFVTDQEFSLAHCLELKEPAE